MFGTWKNGLAYHFVIGNAHGLGDGEIGVGGRWTKQLPGGHLISEEQNQVSIGICLVGNFDESQPTPLRPGASERTLAGHHEAVSFVAGCDYHSPADQRRSYPLPRAQFFHGQTDEFAGAMTSANPA